MHSENIEFQTQVPDWKTKYKVNSYVFGRYICSACNKRWGEPEAHGFMDVKRCPECPPLKKIEGIAGVSH